MRPFAEQVMLLHDATQPAVDRAGPPTAVTRALSDTGVRR